MLILAWLGTIFSGLSVALSLIDDNKREDAASELIPVLKEAADKLVFCKNIHSFFQEIFYGKFERYLDSTTFKQLTIEQKEGEWARIYNEYRAGYRKTKLSSLIPVEQENLNEKFDRPKEVDPIIRRIGVKNEVLDLNEAYPSVIEQIYQLDKLLLLYSTEIKKTGGIPTSQNDTIEGYFKDILIDADRSLKDLVEIIYRIMVVA